VKTKYLKNIAAEEVLLLTDLVEYKEGQIISRTFVQNGAVSITLFSFDKGEEISTHSSDGDAMVTILEGEARITIGGREYDVSGGETIVMPAGIPHAVVAKTRFKMLLTVVFPLPAQK
jgi:quercetin dioxygenase-like cupin family protein